MSETIKGWNLLRKETREACVREIQGYTEEECEERLGSVQAEELLEKVLPYIVEEAYEKGLQDAKETLKERMHDLEVDIDMLLGKL